MSGRASKAAAKAKLAATGEVEPTAVKGHITRTLRRNNTSSIVSRAISDQFGDLTAAETDSGNCVVCGVGLYTYMHTHIIFMHAHFCIFTDICVYTSTYV
jgi:tRNA A22 N-methylase